MNFLPLVSTLCLQLRYECNISHSYSRDKIYKVFLSVGSVLALQSKLRTWNYTTKTEVSVAVKHISQISKVKQTLHFAITSPMIFIFGLNRVYWEWKELNSGLFACIISERLQVWLPQPSASAASSACRGCSGGLPTPAPQSHRLPARPALSCGGLLAAPVLLSLTISALDLL